MIRGLGTWGKVAAIAACLALSSVSHAERLAVRVARWAERAQGGAWLHYELQALRAVEDRPRDVPPLDLVLAGARLHGFIGEGRTIGYHVGLDLAAGGSAARGGFAYDVALFPLGIAVRLGPTSVVAFGAGVGAMGSTDGALPAAALLPLEANVELGEGRLRLLARARAAYVSGALRHDGAPSVPFADELDATLGLRIGHGYHDWGFPSGNGYFGGLAYRELAGAKYVGVVVGYSIDLASRLK